MVEVLDIGDRVGTGSYRLHSRFRGALAFAPREGGCLVSVVEESKCAGPANIVVRGLDFAHADSLAVASDAVFLDGDRVPAGRRSDSTIGPLDLDRGRLAGNLDTLRDTLLCCGPPRSIVYLLAEGGDPAGGFERALARRFRQGLRLLLAGDLAGAAALAGLGHGLTPSGDDFLAGYLLGLCATDAAAARRRAIRAAAESANPFSAALLDCALEGRAIEPGRSLVRSLFERTGAAVARDARRLAAVGASSGADLAAGLYFGVQA